MVDSLGSSEAIGMAASTRPRTAAETATFELGATPACRHRRRRARRARARANSVGSRIRGRTPIGYYKDEDKSAGTFSTIDGDRYSIPGDCATVEADGTITLLGRGSVCINTGGEKVFPEEVEEVPEDAPRIVADAVVVGVPDDKWGEAITALVECRRAPCSTSPHCSTTSRRISPRTRPPNT